MRRPTLIAILIAAAVAAWLASPHLGLDRWAAGTGPEQLADDTATDTAESAIEQRVAVRTRTSSAEPIAREIMLNGRTEPTRTVRLAAETSARVAELVATKGQTVAAGDVIARLDRRDREAAVAEARAALAQRTIEHDAATRLGARGFQAETQVSAAKTALELARYHLQRAEIELAHTEIKAPFAGVLEVLPVELGSFVDIGDTIAELVDLDPILVVSDVPEAAIRHVAAGNPATIRLLDDTLRDGRVRFVARQANSQTRTFRVEVAVANPDHAIPAGISTSLQLTLDSVPAHRVSPGVMVLDDAGRLGVKAVTPDQTVAFHQAEIVRAEAAAVWLAGLPDQLELITVGQGFVAPGQSVLATDEAQVAALLETAQPTLAGDPGRGAP